MEPFIDINGIYSNGYRECSALSIFADACGYECVDIMDIIAKAILFLDRKADIDCRADRGDTVLHIILQCNRLHERISKEQAQAAKKSCPNSLHQWFSSITAPKDLLMVFLSAGADVYATNNDNETPYMVAVLYGRENEWYEALEKCGYEPEPGLTSWSCSIHHPRHQSQKSKLSLQQLCQQRPELRKSDRDRMQEFPLDFSDSNSEVPDDFESHESEGGEIEEISDITSPIEDDGVEIREVVTSGYFDDSMITGLEKEGNTDWDDIEISANHQMLERTAIEDINLEGVAVNFDDWLNDGVDFMDSFNMV
jgi:hypothetical protein